MATRKIRRFPWVALVVISPATALALDFQEESGLILNYWVYDRSDLGAGRLETAYYGRIVSSTGAFPLETESALDFWTDPDPTGAQGVFLDARGNDTLFGTYIVDSYDLNTGEFTTSFTYAGGTGIYTGASGSGISQGFDVFGEFFDLGLPAPELPPEIANATPVAFGYELITSNATISVPVALPVLTLPGSIFGFNVSVTNGVPILIDPLVAIGYDYLVGESDPNFASVRLPFLGDPEFELYLWDGSEYVFEATLAPNETYTFQDGGVDRFRVLGIDPGLGLDPDDPTEFVIALTFAGDGTFTGTMTALSTEVDPVPVPAAVWLLGSAFIGLAGIARRRRPTDASLGAGTA